MLEDVMVGFLKKLGIKLTLSQIDMIKMKQEKIIKICLSQLVEFPIEDIFNQMLDVLKIKLDPIQVQKFCDFFKRKIICEIRDEVYDVLKEIKDLDLISGVISNSFVDAPRVILERADLMKFLDVVVLSRDVCVRKPHPKIFLYATEKAGVSPKESLFIGDVYEIDVWGAKNVGMVAVLMANEKEQGAWRELVRKYTPRPHILPQPDHKISNLREVLEILRHYYEF